MLPPAWRKLVLLLHVVTGVGFLGAVAAFLALALAGEYAAMRLITWTIILPLAAASLLVGVLSSLTTPWGLLRHYWLAVKLGLTLIAVAVLLLQLRTIDALAAGTAGPEAHVAMIVHSSGGLAVLLAATLLSIYKPRGVTRINF